MCSTTLLHSIDILPSIPLHISFWVGLVSLFGFVCLVLFGLGFFAVGILVGFFNLIFFWRVDCWLVFLSVLLNEKCLSIIRL